MKTISSALWTLTLATAWLATPRLDAATPPPDVQIDHLSGNGILTFTPVPGYTNYTIEWAPTALGPWHETWSSLHQVEPQAQSVSVAVPMFFRVVARGAPLIVPEGLHYVPAGSCTIGRNDLTDGLAAPEHTVSVSAFLIDRLEVSRALWEEVADWAAKRGYEFGQTAYAVATNHPITHLAWYDAVKWCNARSEMIGLQPVYYTDGQHATVYRAGTLDLTNGCVAWDADGFRLPTEAEWEKAARGGLEAHNFPWTSFSRDFLLDILGHMANFWNSGDPFDNGTTPVGFYNGTQIFNGPNMVNGVGLYDMAGNVSEMCWDWAGPYRLEPQTDVTGPDQGDQRILRGGSWYDDPSALRLALRRVVFPSSLAPNIGFRCVRRSTTTP